MDPTSEPSVEVAAQARDAKTAMLEIAEQLISERGLDRVSMRDVATAAGQRNNSAVQYHFGSRDGLILQVLRRRLTALDVDRRQRLAEIDEQGLGADHDGLSLTSEPVHPTITDGI